MSSEDWKKRYAERYREVGVMPNRQEAVDYIREVLNARRVYDWWESQVHSDYQLKRMPIGIEWIEDVSESAELYAEDAMFSAIDDIGWRWLKREQILLINENFSRSEDQMLVGAYKFVNDGDMRHDGALLLWRRDSLTNGKDGRPNWEFYTEFVATPDKQEKQRKAFIDSAGRHTAVELQRQIDEHIFYDPLEMVNNVLASMGYLESKSDDPNSIIMSRKWLNQARLDLLPNLLDKLADTGILPKPITDEMGKLVAYLRGNQQGEVEFVNKDVLADGVSYALRLKDKPDPLVPFVIHVSS